VFKAVVFDMFETLVSMFEGRVYFSLHAARELGISEEEYCRVWHRTEKDRSTGKLTIKEAVRISLLHMGIDDEEKVSFVARRRRESLEEIFFNISKESLDLLDELKKRGILIGLISNCFSDEYEIIKESKLYPYFNSAMFSYEQGICKPDKEIYYRLLKEINVEAKECLYVGDGGSKELFTARDIGMKPIQAEWFRELAIEPYIPCPVYKEFEQARTQQDILKFL